jgi:hypothetical protein
MRAALQPIRLVFLLPGYENDAFEMFEEWFDVQMMSTVRDAYLDEAIEYVG